MSKNKRSQLPSAAELLEAVADYLEKDLLPGLEGRQRFNTRVSANALRIVQRELEQPDNLDCLGTLRTLLDSDATDEEALLLKLAESIRNGALNEGHPGLMKALRQITLQRLAVDNPRYSSYLAATESD